MPGQQFISTPGITTATLPSVETDVFFGLTLVMCQLPGAA